MQLACIAVGAIRQPDYSVYRLTKKEAETALDMIRVVAEAFVACIPPGQKPRIRITCGTNRIN